MSFILVENTDRFTVNMSFTRCYSESNSSKHLKMVMVICNEEETRRRISVFRYDNGISIERSLFEDYKLEHDDV